VFPPIVGAQLVSDNLNVISIENIANLRSNMMWYRSRGGQYDTKILARLYHSYRVRYDTGLVSHQYEIKL
jgi:hypothetical protein